MNKTPVGMPSPLLKKYENLKKVLGRYSRAALAFSGGVDSSFLLAAAVQAGMEEVLAVTLVSRFFTREERDRTVGLAKSLGVAHLCLDLDILSDPRVVKNDARRCYYCKQAGFSAIRAAAGGRGFDVLIHGINLDDLNDYRPGIEAAKELGFTAPLVAAGFSKQEIRDGAKALGLPNWDLPSQSCLATRIPQNDAITAEALARVEQAEMVLHGLGLSQVRVRCHGDLARIELMEADMERVNSKGFRRQMSSAVKSCGFSFVALDLDGYTSGSVAADGDTKPVIESDTI